MKFWVASSLHYQVTGPASLLCSLSCIQSLGQHILEESLSTSRDVKRSDLSVGLDANRFTKLDMSEPGDLDVKYNATVETSVSIVDAGGIGSRGDMELDEVALPYLFPSRYAPADRLRAAAYDLFGGIEGKYAQSMAIEDWLFKNLRYQFGSSNEQSWALDTLETRSGVCRDFAHLGIAFCRALTIPARYLTVYAYGLDPQDFHAVFEVYIDGTWYVIDGTRLAPLNGMVRIASGRDASDAAVATLFGSIMGVWVNVQTELAFDETEEFKAVTRNSLRADGKTLFLA